MLSLSCVAGRAQPFDGKRAPGDPTISQPTRCACLESPGRPRDSVGVWHPRFRRPRYSVTNVAFFPDGRRVVSAASDDKTASIWDPQSRECLEVIEGSDDVEAIAGAASDVRWRAFSRDVETAVKPVEGGDPVAWFSVALESISSDLSGRAWAGAYNDHVYIIQLEGEPRSR